MDNGMLIPPAPPKRMPVKRVPVYVQQKTGKAFSLATVYNWINLGVRGEKLRIVWGKRNARSIFPDMRFTTAPWIDDFLRRVAARHGIRN